MEEGEKEELKGEEELRGAWDIGSGATKLTIAIVNNLSNKITKILFSKEREVLVGQALKQSRDFSLPLSILQLLSNTLFELKNIADSFEKEYNKKIRYVAIATAAFREAKNGVSFLEDTSKNLGVDIKLISQIEEGKFGFLTALNSFQLENKEEEVNGEDIIAWDSGGSSFQLTSIIKSSDNNLNNNLNNNNEITDEELRVFEGAFGSSKVTSLMIEEVQHDDFRIRESANPSSLSDCENLISIIKNSLNEQLAQLESENRFPSWINNKLQRNCKIIAIGGDTNMFRLASIAIQSRIITREKVWNILVDKIVGKSDEELNEFLQAGMIAPKLCLLCAVIDVFQFNSITFYYTTGSTLGLLTSASVWN